MYTPNSLLEAVQYFSDPDHCHEFLTQARWPEGVTCPHCGTENPYVINAKRGKLWRCRSKECKRQFTVKVGTVMEDSHIPLEKWLPTMWLLANAKNGISSYEVARDLGVTQKTAWFMLHRIRLAMQDDLGGLLCGEVEVDETFIGGKARNMHKARRAEKITGTGGAGKTAVMGLLERHGKVRTKVVPNVRRQTLQPEVRKHVEPGSAVFSDDLHSYKGLNDQFIHEVVNHAEEYVRGRVHTNCLENFWSLLKRSLSGTYVSVEPFHLFRYLDEQEFRFNERKSTDGQRFAKTAGAVAGKRLTYAELIGQNSTSLNSI